MICSNPSCGRTLPDGAAFCKYCGAKQSPIAQPQGAQPQGAQQPYGAQPQGAQQPYGMPSAAASARFRGCLGRAWDDFKASPSKLPIALKLALFQFIPFVGGVVEGGYAYTWGKEAALGRTEMLSKKLIRPGVLDAGLYSWGASTVLSLIVYFVTFLISLLFGALFSLGGSQSMAVGSIISLIVSIALCVFAMPMISMLSLRAAICGRVRSGFAFSHLIEMIKVKGKLGKLLGAFWAPSAVLLGVSFVLSLILSFTVVAAGNNIFENLGYAIFYGADAGTYIVQLLIAAAMTVLPLTIILMLALFLVRAYTDMIIARALGYWLQDFQPETWPEYQQKM